MLSLLRPSPQEIARFRERQLSAPFSYAEVGATRQATPPPGYHVDRSDVIVGTDFAGARAKLSSWAHFGSPAGRIRVVPPAPEVEPGATVVLLGDHWGLHTLSACRVVYVEETPTRFAYAYGTLEHAVRGEELFELEQTRDGDVHFRLYAFSRPAHPLVKLGAPLARLLQKRAGREYGRALT
jgi:uncharacterized protein (UPF0548 family)